MVGLPEGGDEAGIYCPPSGKSGRYFRNLGSQLGSDLALHAGNVVEHRGA